jgi:16S rRNA (cytosine967-C5)-methyltransferase
VRYKLDLQLRDWHYEPVTVEKPREIAMEVLQRHAEGSERADTLLDEALLRAGPGLSAADRGLARELAFGVLRWQATLDWLIAGRTHRRTQKAALQILLRLGLYQLFWLDRIPDHAAVHETVELGKRLGFGAQSGFLNAVLRGCVRERGALCRQLEELKAREPHLGFSHPQWLCDRWAARWGNDKLLALLEWNNTPPHTFIRVNTLRATPEQLAAQFEKEGVLFTPRAYEWVPENFSFELREHPLLTSLPSFQQGLFYVQDPSTLLAPSLLDPQPGQRLLDLCAAPGGKTTLLAQFLRNQGEVVAEDTDPNRMKLLVENCARLGVTCVETLPGISNGSVPAGTDAGAPSAQFDGVLVDVPCSNTGVLRRRVDVRWRIQPAEIERLRKLQLGLLSRAAGRVKPGGALVYSTCSLEPEENENVVEQFLTEAKRFRLERQRQLLPFANQVDGAYVARLRAD